MSQPVKYSADINNLDDGWVQVTTSGDDAHKLTEQNITTALSALHAKAGVSVDDGSCSCGGGGSWGHATSCPYIDEDEPALSTKLQEPVGELHGPYGWLNGHRALFSEDSWTLESDPLENSEEYFAIPLYALIDPFEQIGKDYTPSELQMAEPVAWQRLTDKNGWHFISTDDLEHYRSKGSKLRPLYTSPIYAHQPVTAGLEKDIREECAAIGYRVCAETRHVTLGDKVRNAILAAMKSESRNAQPDILAGIDRLANGGLRK